MPEPCSHRPLPRIRRRPDGRAARGAIGRPIRVGPPGRPFSPAVPAARRPAGSPAQQARPPFPHVRRAAGAYAPLDRAASAPATIPSDDAAVARAALEPRTIKGQPSSPVRVNDHHALCHLRSRTRRGRALLQCLRGTAAAGGSRLAVARRGAAVNPGAPRGSRAPRRAGGHARVTGAPCPVHAGPASTRPCGGRQARARHRYGVWGGPPQAH